MRNSEFGIENRVRRFQRKGFHTLVSLLVVSSVFATSPFPIPHSHFVYAEVPQYISYQGRLMDVTGTKAVTGSITITFRLYDAATGGSEVWKEAHSVAMAAADNGIFNVVLGSVTALSSVSFNSPMWLSVQVSGDSEMTPRQRLTASGYALNADKLDSLDSSSFLRTDIDTSTSGKMTITRSGLALLIKPSADPSADTKLVDVQNAAGTSKFSVDLEGDVVAAGDTMINAQGDLRLGDSDSSNYVAFQGPSTVSSNVTWTMPSADGSANQVLTTNGSSTLSWATASSLSSAVTGTTNTSFNVGSGTDATATDVSLLFGTTTGQESLIFDGDSTDDFLLSDDLNIQTNTLKGTTAIIDFSSFDVDTSGNTTLAAQADLRLADADSSNYLALQAPTTVSSNVTWTFPSADGTSGQVLKTDGSGTLAWATTTDLSGTGDITTVTAGSGLTGGGASGDVTLTVGAGSGITVNADDVAIATDGVTAAMIIADAVGTSEIATDGVGAAEITADAVGTSEIATDGVGVAEIAANSVDASELVATAVTAASYGSATQAPSFTVDADGRLTAASNNTISLTSSNIQADQLNFSEFTDSMSLDATTTIDMNATVGADLILDDMSSAETLILQNAQSTADTATLYVVDTATANLADFVIAPSDGGLLLDTPGAADFDETGGSPALTNTSDAREALAIASRPTETISDGALKLGRKSSKWEYIWYNSSEDKFVLSASTRVESSSPAYLLFSPPAVSGQPVGSRYGIKFDPEVTPKTLSFVEITSPLSSPVENTLFEMKAGGRMGLEFVNLITNSSFEAFSALEDFHDYDPTYATTSAFTGTNTGVLNTTAGYQGGWKNFSPDEWTWVAGAIFQHAPFLMTAAGTTSFNTDAVHGKSAVGMKDSVVGTAFTTPGDGNDGAIKQVVRNLKPSTVYAVGVKAMVTNATNTTALLDVDGEDTVTDCETPTDSKCGRLKPVLQSTPAVLSTTSTSFADLIGTFTTDSSASAVTIYVMCRQTGAPVAADLCRFDTVQVVRGKSVPEFAPNTMVDTGDQTLYGSLRLGRTSDDKGGILSVDQFVRTRGIELFTDDPGLTGKVGGAVATLGGSGIFPPGPGWNETTSVQAGVNLYVGGSYSSTAPANRSYKVKIATNGTPDQFSWWYMDDTTAWVETVGGNSVASPINVIASEPGTANLNDGVKVWFSSTTVGAAGDSWWLSASNQQMFGAGTGAMGAMGGYDSYAKTATYTAGETRIYKDPERFSPTYGKLVFQDGATKVSLSDLASLVTRPSTINAPSSGATGYGLGMSAWGNYTGNANRTYKAQIDGVGTANASSDKFRWSRDGGATWVQTLVAINDNGSQQFLEDGIYISFWENTFSSDVYIRGGAVGDSWTFTVSSGTTTSSRVESVKSSAGGTDRLAITGHVRLVQGSNILLTQTGNDIEIASSGTITATSQTLGKDETAPTPNLAGQLKFISGGNNAWSSTFNAGTQSGDITYTLPISLPGAGLTGLLKSTDGGGLSWDTALSDANVSDTLTASIVKGSGSTTNAVDLATAEVAGTLPVLNGGTGATSLTGLLVGNGTSAFTTTANNSGNWDTAYTDRLKWDGGSTGLTAATGRTSLELGTLATLNAVGSAEITDGTVGTSELADGTIANVDVSATAAIAGTKISPDFGTQDILTTGNLEMPFGGLGRYENLLLRSEEFETASWIRNANLNAPTADTIVAPDGKTTAEALTPTAALATNIKQTSATSAAASTAYTFSVWAKVPSATKNLILTVGDDGATVTTNTATAALTTTWQRVSVTYTAVATPDGSVYAQIGDGGWTADTIHVWGAQVEKGVSTPNIYVRTTSETRALAYGAQINQDLHVSGNMEVEGIFSQHVSTSDQTLSGNLVVNGNATLGDNVADSVTFNANTLVYEGSIADANELTLTVTNPSVDVTLTIPALGASANLVTTGDSNTVTGTMVSESTLVLDGLIDDNDLAVGAVDLDTSEVAGALPLVNLADDATAGKVLRSGGVGDPAWSTATYPATTTASQLLHSSSDNVVAGLATANSGVLVTSGTGVPSIATDIPTAVTIGTKYVYRADGTDVAVADGGTGGSDAATARTNLGLAAGGAGDIWVEKAGDTMTGDLLIDTTGAADFDSTGGSPALTNVDDAREALAIASRPTETISDGAIKLGRKSSKWEYIWYNSDEDKFVLSATTRIESSSPAYLLFSPPTASGSTPGSRYGIKFDPEVTPKTLSFVEITSPLSNPVENTLFEMKAGGRMAMEFANLVKNGSFEAFSGMEAFRSYDAAYATSTSITSATQFGGMWDQTAGFQGGWDNFAPDEWAWVKGDVFQHSPVLLASGTATTNFTTDAAHGKSSVGIRDHNTSATYTTLADSPFNDGAIKQRVTGLKPSTTYAIGVQAVVVNANSANSTTTAMVDLDGEASGTGQLTKIGVSTAAALTTTSATYTGLIGTFTTTATADDVTLYLICKQTGTPAATDLCRFDAVQVVASKSVPEFAPSNIIDTGDQTLYGSLRLGRTSQEGGGVLSVDKYVRTRGIELFTDDPGLTGRTGGGVATLGGSGIFPPGPGWNKTGYNAATVKLFTKGSYLSTAPKHRSYKIEIAQEGTGGAADKFSWWYSDETTGWTETAGGTSVASPIAVAIDGANPVTLNAGVQIWFDSLTAGTVGDSWWFSASNEQMFAAGAMGTAGFNSFAKETNYTAGETRIYKEQDRYSPYFNKLVFQDGTTKVSLSELASTVQSTANTQSRIEQPLQKPEYKLELITSGNYNGTVSKTFRVEIDGVAGGAGVACSGYDRFKWTDDGAAAAPVWDGSNVCVTATAYTLPGSQGVSIYLRQKTTSSTTATTSVGQYWTFNVYTGTTASTKVESIKTLVGSTDGTALSGMVRLKQGSNILLTQTGNDIEIASSGTITATSQTLGKDETAPTPNLAGQLKFISGGDNAWSSTFNAGTQSGDITYTLPTSIPGASTTGLLKFTNVTSASGTLGWDTTAYVPAARTLTGGAGIATIGDLSANRTIDFAAGELNSLTWGDNSAANFTHTFNTSGATDPVITFSDNTIDVTTGTLKQGGTAVSLAGHNHDAAYVNVTGDTMTGNLTVGDATTDVLTLDTAAVTTDGGSNDSAILRLRGTYDSNGVGTDVTSSTYDLDLINNTSVTGTTPAGQLDLNFWGGAVEFTVDSSGKITTGSVDSTSVVNNTLAAADLLVNVVSSLSDGTTTVTNDGGNITLSAGSGITVSANDSTDTITISATGSGGTVTSVALSAPAEFTVSGSPVTGSGTLAFAKTNQNANVVYAGPSSGSAAAPTFRALVDDDIPNGITASNYVLKAGDTISGDVVVDTTGADELSAAGTTAANALAIATNSTAAGDADGVIKLGKDGGNWQSIHYDASLRSGAGQFVFSKPIKILGDSSAAVMDFEDNSDPNAKVTKTLTYDKAAGTDGLGAFVFGDQIEVPASSPAYMTFKTSTGERYAWKLDPDVTPITFSMVKFASAGGTETELFRFGADGSFSVRDPAGTIRTLIDASGKFKAKGKNIVQNASFDVGWDPVKWESFNSGYVSPLTSTAKFGTKAVRVLDNNTTQVRGLRQILPYFDQFKGEVMTLSVWARHSGVSGTVTASVGFDDGVTAAGSRYKDLTGISTTYQPFSYTFTLPSTATKLDLYLYGAGGGDSVGAAANTNTNEIYYDAVTLAPGPLAIDYEPSPIFDTGSQVIYGNLAIGAHMNPNSTGQPAQLVFGEPPAGFAGSGDGFGAWGGGAGTITYQRWDSNAGGQFFFNRGIRFTPESGQSFGATLSLMSDPSTTFTAEGLIHLGSATLTSGSGGGTYMSMNAQSAFTGDFVNFQRGGTTKFKVDKDGNITGTATSVKLDSDPGLVSSASGLSLLRICSNGQVLKWTSASSSWGCAADSTGGSPSFDTVTGATNTTAALVVGTGASLGVSGTGTITATDLVAGSEVVADSEVGNDLTIASTKKGSFAGPALTDATSEDILLNLTQTLNDTSAAAGTQLYQGFKVNLTETDKTGWDTVNLMDLQVGGTSKYTVSDGGSVTTGTWSATAIGPTKGGTGLTSYTAGDVLYASAANTLSALAAGTNGQVLKMQASGLPAWAADSTGGAPSFDTLAAGTNTTAALVVGTGASLGVSGTGTITATDLVAGSEVVADSEVANNLTIASTAAGSFKPSTDVVPLTLKRGTDTSPAADLFKITNAAENTSLFVVNASGQLATGDVPWARLSSVPTNLDTDSTNDLTTTLADGKIIVGNSSNVAAAVTMSGDVTMSNAGVTTLGAAKITKAKLAELAPSAQATPDKTVAIAAGKVYVSGNTLVSFSATNANLASGGNCAYTPTASGKFIKALIALKSDGTLGCTMGTEQANTTAAQDESVTYPSDRLPIAEVILKTNGTTAGAIENIEAAAGTLSYLYQDVRPAFNMGVKLDSSPGLVMGANGLSLLRTCADGQVLKWTAGTSSWACAADSGGSGTGDVNTVGDCETGDCFELDNVGTENALYFEGTGADDANEVKLTTTNPATDVTVTIPAATTTLVGTDVTQTLTNKTLTDASTSFADEVNNTKLKLQLSGLTTDRTLTIQDASGTIALTGHNHAAGDIVSGALSLARGGTNADLSGTGGANQFLKQTSAGANITVGAIADADVPDDITLVSTKAGSFTTTSTTDLSKGLNVSHTGAITGTGYGGYFSKTGTSTTNIGLYATASGATNNYAGLFEGNVAVRKGDKVLLDSDDATADTYLIRNSGSTTIDWVVDGVVLATLKKQTEAR